VPQREGAIMGGSQADLESSLARIWSDALQHTEAIAPNANFFEAGGTSVTMMIILFRVKEELGVDLPPGALMEAPSFGAFCALVETKRASPEVTEFEIG
jgi:acyl carrier protein